MSQSAFIFDSFVATGKNIAFLSGGQQYIADVEKFDEMNPSNTNNGKYNHWNIVNEDGKILHNLFKVEDFKPRSSTYKVKRGDRTNTQRDRIDTRPPVSGCPQVNLCQQTNMFFSLDQLDEIKDIRSDTKSYEPETLVVKTESQPEGISLSQLILDESQDVRHDEELRKYPSVKYMYAGYDTVHEALLNRFAPSGDFRTPNTTPVDVGSGWQYIKNYNASEHIAIFNDIFNDQEITLFADAVSTKTFYDDTYSVDGHEYAVLDDGSEVHLNDTISDAALIPSLLNYTVVSVGASQEWVRAFPDDEICHNIFEFKMENCKWVDQDFSSMSFIIVNESTVTDIEKVPYNFISHGGCDKYQLGAYCRGGVLKVRFSIPYSQAMTLEQFKAWIATIGSIKLKNNPSLPNADARSKRFFTLDGTQDWSELSNCLQLKITEKCCDAFVRTSALAPMPVKLAYIGATEKDFTQSVPFNSITKLNFKVSGSSLNMSDAAIAGKCETTRDSTTVFLRLRFWLGSYDVTTAEQANAFFKEHPLLIKFPSAADDAVWANEEDVPPDTTDNFYPDKPHYVKVDNVRDYKQIDVCGPLLYLVYDHSLETESQRYTPNGTNGEGFIPMTTYSNTMSRDEKIIDDNELEEKIADPDRNMTDISVFANYETVESVDSINKLGLGSNTIKSNLFSVSISNLGLDNNTGLSEGDKNRIKRWITEKVEHIAEHLAPAHTQLFKTFINE